MFFRLVYALRVRVVRVVRVRARSEEANQESVAPTFWQRTANLTWLRPETAAPIAVGRNCPLCHTGVLLLQAWHSKMATSYLSPSLQALHSCVCVV